MKALEWIAAIVRAWITARGTGSIEIHFHEGAVTRLIETKALKPPQ